MKKSIGDNMFLKECRRGQLQDLAAVELHSSPFLSWSAR